MTSKRGRTDALPGTTIPTLVPRQGVRRLQPDGVSADGRAVELIVEVLDLTGDESDLIVTVRAVGDDRDVEVPTRLRDVALFIDDAVMVPHKDAYVARSRVGVPDGDPAEDDIYSFHATALVEDYPVRHLGDE